MVSLDAADDILALLLSSITENTAYVAPIVGLLAFWEITDRHRDGRPDYLAGANLQVEMLTGRQALVIGVVLVIVPALVAAIFVRAVFPSSTRGNRNTGS